MDELNEMTEPERAAYLRGLGEALGEAALAMARQAAEDAAAQYQEGWWAGFGEGLLSRPSPLRRSCGLARDRRRPRSLTRPPAARAVAR